MCGGKLSTDRFSRRGGPAFSALCVSWQSLLSRSPPATGRLAIRGGAAAREVVAASEKPQNEQSQRDGRQHRSGEHEPRFGPPRVLDAHPKQTRDHQYGDRHGSQESQRLGRFSVSVRHGGQIDVQNGREAVALSRDQIEDDGQIVVHVA